MATRDLVGRLRGDGAAAGAILRLNGQSAARSNPVENGRKGVIQVFCLNQITTHDGAVTGSD